MDLAQVLSGLPATTDPNVLVGIGTADDAAVYRVNDELALIQTVDFFTPVVDEPYWFGAIAAANSLSDVYAMGGRPTLALNVVGFPRKSSVAPLSVLAEILRGGAEKAKEAGIDIVGGHTLDDREPKYGLCVSGFVHPDRIWRNVGARAGDRLVLTKPLGSGIISTAVRAGEAKPAVERAALEMMALLNRGPAEIARALDVHACTDVTGFGFLGHLHEMLAEGSVSAHVTMSAIPLLDGVRELAAAGYVPGGSKRNRSALDGAVTYGDDISEIDRMVLSDAQTSGGLLFALSPTDAAALCAELAAADVPAVDVGEFIADAKRTIDVVA